MSKAPAEHTTSKPDKSSDSKHKYFKEQFDDEDVLLVFKKHPIVMRRGLILACFAVLLGALPSFIKPEVNVLLIGLAAGFGGGLILMFPFWVRWYFSVYIMTNKRFIQQTRSILQVNVVDIGLDQVQMINYQINGLEQTVLNFGTIIVQTYVGDLVIHSVHHPARIQKRMVHILRDLNIHPSTRLGTVAGEPGAIEP
ncbi:MAG: PH domain-containing protein [Candidatus Saccharimonadales bacterium]